MLSERQTQAKISILIHFVLICGFSGGYPTENFFLSYFIFPEAGLERG